MVLRTPQRPSEGGECIEDEGMVETRGKNRRRLVLASAFGLVALSAKLLMPARVEMPSKGEVLLQGQSGETPSRASGPLAPSLRESASHSSGGTRSPIPQASNAGMMFRARVEELRLQGRGTVDGQPAAPDTLGIGQWDPAKGAVANSARGVSASRIASMEKFKIHFPSNREMSGLDQFRVTPRVDERALQHIAPRREPLAAERTAKEQKELAKVKQDLGMPAPKAKLDAALYDPWEHEYDSVVRSEEAKANKLAQDALKARQAEQRARKKSVQ